MLNNLLSRLLNIQPGEGKAIALLGGYSFLIGVFQAYYISLANASFLAEFGVDYLAQGYIGNGLVGYLFGAWLTRMQRRLPFTRLIVRVLALPLVLVCVFWLGFELTSSRWLVLGMFACIGPFIALIYFVFRTLVNQLFNLRQSKRLFGLISSGDVISAIIGFFSIPLLIGFFDNINDLLLIAALALGLCWGLLHLINHHFSDTLSGTAEARASEVSGGLFSLFEKRYFILIVLMSALVICGFYYIDYVFLSQLRFRFENKAFLARFIGLLYGTIRIVELLVKTLLSGRLLSSYGLRFGLAALPLMLCVSTGLAAAFSLGLPGGVTAVFLLVALSKMIERVAVKSFHDPSFNLLYQPLDRAQGLAVQARIEGIVQPLAVVIAAVSLWLLSAIGAFDLVALALVLVVAGWLVAAVLMYREYRVALLDNLASGAERAGARGVDEAGSVELLSAPLRQRSVGEVGYLLDWLWRLAPDGEFLPAALHHPDPDVRQQILREIGARGYISHREQVRQLLETEEHAQVRQTGQQTWERLAEIERRVTGSTDLQDLCSSPAAEERRLAAWTLGERQPDAGGRMLGADVRGSGAGTQGLDTDVQGSGASVQMLETLLHDRDPDVRRQALITAGKWRRPECWAAVVEQIPSPYTCHVAAAVLASLGEVVLPSLEEYGTRAGLSRRVAKCTARLCGGIGGDRAVSLLLGMMNSPENSVRLEALQSLRRLRYQPRDTDEQALIEQQIEAVSGHLAWNMAAILDLQSERGAPELKAVLGREIDQLRERVFLLLALIYPPRQIELVRDSFTSGQANRRVYALELLDVFVEPRLKEWIFPILDDLSLGQRVGRLGAHFPQQRLRFVERLRDVVNSEYTRADRWVRACALHALGEVGSGRLFDEQLAQLFNPDPLLREVAGWGIYRADPAVYAAHVEKLAAPARQELDRAFVEASGQRGERILSIFAKVEQLKDMELLAGLPEVDLVELALACEELQLPAGAAILTRGEPIDAVYILIEGEVDIDQGGEGTVLSRGDLLDANVWGLGGTSKAALEATCSTRVLSVDRDLFSGFIAEYREVAAKLAQVPGSSPDPQ